MVLFDTTFLLPLIHPDIRPPENPQTSEPVEKYSTRIKLLVEKLTVARSKIVIPTPALSELLVRSGEAGHEYMANFHRNSVFKIIPFDRRAAVELAIMTKDAIDRGDRRDGMTPDQAPWQKVKLDRQIVATGKVEEVETIYTDDNGMIRFAQIAEIHVVSSWELPLPPIPPQIPLPLIQVSH